jgi:hypothetical protein
MEGVSNHYIESILHPICKKFLGVFSADTIPEKLLEQDTFSIVCNLSKAGETGSHFVSIIALRNRVLYIDSLGLPCIVPEICVFLAKLRKPLYINSKQVQATDSKYCGFYCILFVLYFDKDVPMIKLQFDDANLLTNDNLCIEYIKQLLK